MTVRFFAPGGRTLLPAALPGQELCALFQVGKRLYPRRRRGRWVDDEHDRRAVAFLIELMPVGIFVVPLISTGAGIGDATPPCILLLLDRPCMVTAGNEYVGVLTPEVGAVIRFPASVA